jgi:hypothetical protein
VASAAKTDAFLWRQITDGAEVSGILGHAVIIAGSGGNFKSGVMRVWPGTESQKRLSQRRGVAENGK